MENLTENYVRDLLGNITDPYAGSDLVSLGWVRGVGIDGNRVSVDLLAGYPMSGIREARAAEITAALESDSRIEKAVVNLDWKVVPHAVQGELKPNEHQVFFAQFTKVPLVRWEFFPSIFKLYKTALCSNTRR